MMRLYILVIIVIVMAAVVLPWHKTAAVFEPLVNKSCAPEIGIAQVPGSPCDWSDLIGTIQRIIRTIILLSPILALLFILVGGFMMMFGGPFPDRVSAGKNMIITALVGYILVLVSGFIIDLVLDVFQIRPHVPAQVEKQ